jgi:hypothetical protein
MNSLKLNGRARIIWAWMMTLPANAAVTLRHSEVCADALIFSI